MQKILLRTLTTIMLIAAPFVVQFSIAQPPIGGTPPGGGPPNGGGPPCWPPPCVPVDGGVGFLIAAGLAFGTKKVLDSRRS